MSKPHLRTGESAWAKMPKVSSELFTLTYGAIVNQLVKDFDDAAEVNKQLEIMGYNIGVRLIDEFLAKSNVLCQDFKDTADVVAKVAFKMFLGTTAEVTNWNNDNTACSLILTENPLAEFVELPPHMAKTLWFSNLLCGVLRGALEAVQMRVECTFVRDVLRGDEMNEIRLVMRGMIEETAGEEYHED